MIKTNSRVSVTCEKETLTILTSLAKQRHISVSAVAHDLITDSIDRIEDAYLSRLAERRYRQNSKLISHKEAWKTTKSSTKAK
ncbi:MAG: ribbon-helix-helix protein, CopG family [Alphaproteobacteria bacterium]|nr:ribbon-helix-helix protein, CopG family [Alphaproteobacteria bacterium]